MQFDVVLGLLDVDSIIFGPNAFTGCSDLFVYLGDDVFANSNRIGGNCEIINLLADVDNLVFYFSKIYIPLMCRRLETKGLFEYLDNHTFP